MPKMTDEELRGLLRSEITQSVNYLDSQLKADRIKALRYYHGDMSDITDSSDADGQSNVVVTEVADTIEYIMPGLMNIFYRGGGFARFAPRQQEDVQSAEQATDLVNFVIQNDNPGFLVMHTAFKDALLSKMGVVKAYWDETETDEVESYSDLDVMQVAQLVGQEGAEITAQEEREENGAFVYDIEIKRTKKEGRVVLENVPPEEFLFSRRARSLADCDFVAHRTEMTVGDLVAMGYDRAEIEEYASAGEDISQNNEKLVRFQNSEQGLDDDSLDKTMRDVLVTEAYIRTDYNGDGKPELRRVVAIGDACHVLENEQWDKVPFAVGTPILMPHRMVGTSVADLVLEVQKAKTGILRQLHQNMYLTNNSRVTVVEGRVNLDDLLTSRPGGIVRMDEPGMVQPLGVPQIGQQGFQMLEYWDQLRDQRTGFSKASMGLDPDSLQSTTAAAVNATIQGGQAKIEMIARVFAETLCKDLAFLVLHLCQKHMDSERVIRLRNEFVSVDPRAWANKFDIDVTVGLGTGAQDERVAMMMQVAGKQEILLQTLGPDNPVVSLPQYVNTLRKIAESAGFKDVDQFFNPPSQVAQAMQMQQAQQQPQGPTDADIKVQEAQARIQLEREKAEAEIALKREQMMAEMELKRQEFEAKTALRQQELETEAALRAQAQAMGGQVSTNLPGAGI